MLAPTLLWVEVLVLSIGVIGYDVFANFTLVVDRLGGKMSFVKNNN